MDYNLGKHVDFTGVRFGRLVAIEYVGANRWMCQCDCGNNKVVRASSLKKGYTKSCGCIGGRTTHGMSKTSRLYHVWSNMKQRCFNPNNTYYKDYGGRGITVCDEWLDFAVFNEWAMATGYDENAERGKCTIDRINNDDGYYPDNCRWVDSATQRRNQRKAVRKNTGRPVQLIDENGKVLKSYQSLASASEDTGCRVASIWNVCNGIYKTTLGMRFQYANTDESK